jgi:hypothetical protein
MSLQMMVILEYCGGGTLHKALQKDAKTKDRRLVRPSIQHSSSWIGGGCTLLICVVKVWIFRQ